MPETEALEATHRRCLDCDALTDNISWDECDNCGSDAFEFLHVTKTPLGHEDDDDHHIAAGPWGAERWEYEAGEPDA